MNLKSKFLVSIACISSLSAVAQADQLYSDETGTIVLDTNNADFSRFCGDTSLSISEDGALIFDFDEEFLSIQSKRGGANCQARYVIDVPDGWRVNFDSTAVVAGSFSGRAIAQLQHTLSGTSERSESVSNSSGDDTFFLENPFVYESACGESFQVKARTNIRSLSTSGSVEASDGWIELNFDWVQC